MIRVGYPIVDDAGTVIGAVYAGINVTWLNTAIGQWQLGEKASIDITDRNGILIARHPDPRGVGQPISDSLKPFLSAKTQRAAEVTGADGVVRLYGYVPISVGASDGLAVFVGRDRAQLFADINRSIWLNAAVVLIGLLLSACLSCDLCPSIPGSAIPAAYWPLQDAGAKAIGRSAPAPRVASRNLIVCR